MREELIFEEIVLEEGRLAGVFETTEGTLETIISGIVHCIDAQCQSEYACIY